MEIIVNENSRLEFVQEEFSSAFRYLKLEFPALNADGVARTKPLTISGVAVADTAKTIASHTLIIVPGMTIGTLKQRFIADFGVPIQVMRLIGNTWIETTLTDGWTLDEQNQHGERLSKRTRRG